MDTHAAQIVLQRNFGVQTGHAPLLPGQGIDTLVERLVILRTLAAQVLVQGVGTVRKRLPASELLQRAIAMLGNVHPHLALGSMDLPRGDPDLAALELA